MEPLAKLFHCPASFPRFQFLGIPPKGEHNQPRQLWYLYTACFQFLGIPLKGERFSHPSYSDGISGFPISRDPPEGGTVWFLKEVGTLDKLTVFPISRDPPEGGTKGTMVRNDIAMTFPISRDPPEGGTPVCVYPTLRKTSVSNF